MSAREAFVDTNILVYAVAADHPKKQKVARGIVERGFTKGCYAISCQVLLELYVTLTRKVVKPLDQNEALRFTTALTAWDVVETTTDLVLAACVLARRHGLSVWDASILEAARAAGCDQVLSEDLTHGGRYAGITVRNPFAPAPPH